MCGLRHCPPTPLQPLELWLPRKFAHSLKLALPMITAPASRSPFRDSRILRCRCARQRERASSRLLSIAGVDVVFQQNRDAVQWPARSMLLAFLIELSGNAARIRIQLNDRVQIEPPCRSAGFCADKCRADRARSADAMT
jgi:hypothetical protein